MMTQHLTGVSYCVRDLQVNAENIVSLQNFTQILHVSHLYFSRVKYCRKLYDILQDVSIME